MGEIDCASIVRGAFDAALHDPLWDSWANNLLTRLGDGGAFMLLDADNKSLIKPIAMVGQDRAADEYVQGHYLNDPQVKIASSFSRSGTYVGLPGVDLEEFAIADYLRWQESNAHVGFTNTAVMALTGTPLRAALSVHRSRASGGMEQAAYQALASMVPDLQCAMDLSFQFGALLQKAYWDGIVVGDAGQMVFLLSERGTVMRHTDAAGMLIARADGLDIVGGRLSLGTASKAQELERIIARALDSLEPHSGSMRLSRPSGRCPLILMCYPLPRSSRMLAPWEAGALLRVIDPSRPDLPSCHILEQAFGLTRREAEFGMHLAAGHSVESASVVLNIKIPTARTYLRRLYEKTGAVGQANLIRLMSVMTV